MPYSSGKNSRKYKRRLCDLAYVTQPPDLEQAESVFYFQMNGCLSINRLMLRNHCNDWKQIQTVIDKFIKAGLESFLIHDQREENASDNFCSKISPTVTASSTLR